MPNNSRKSRSVLQNIYLWLHRKKFARRLKRQVAFPGMYVISVGNLSAGGTGKTPVVQFLAQHCIPMVRTMAVLRGYGGTSSRSGLLVSDGERILTSYREAGDEAVLLALQKGLLVAAGADRPDLVHRYGEGVELLILDDAFQNPSIFRNHDLVLLDATVPPEKISLFPSGRFREDLEALDRANCILLTRSDQVPERDLRRLESMIREHSPTLPLYRSAHAFESIVPPLRKKRAGAFCGIGNPGSFYHLLERQKIRIEMRKAFPDHHPFTASEIRDLFRGNDLHWITTEKDFVRIRELEELTPDELSRIHVAHIRLEIEEGRADEFLSVVLGPLHRRIRKNRH